MLSDLTPIGINPSFDAVYLVGENKNINEFVEHLKNEHDLEISPRQTKYICHAAETQPSTDDKIHAIRIRFVHGQRMQSIKNFLDSFHKYRNQSGNQNSIYLYITYHFYNQVIDAVKNLLLGDGVKCCESINAE